MRHNPPHNEMQGVAVVVYVRERRGRSQPAAVDRFIRLHGALACALLVAAPASMAQLSSAPHPFIEELRQQERERALREQQQRGVGARGPREAPVPAPPLPEGEAPCFRIERLVLDGEGAGDFQWLLASAAGGARDDSPVGRCLGARGIDIVIGRLQKALVAGGFVSTRVLAAAQDFSTGTLRLTLVPGRIAAIRLADGSSPHASPWNAIPARPGELLNLRDVGQGLENLERLPSAEADIRIEPSAAADARPGDSDLVVAYRQAKRWRGTLSLDDSGTRATGRLQAGATLALDNPLGLSDLLYVNASHSVDSRLLGHRERGTEGQSLHYSIPWGDWLLGGNASKHRYHQRVAGAFEGYDYAGTGWNADLRVARLLHRDPQRKTTASVRAWRRESHNFIDDTEIGPQRRIVGGWELSLDHKEFVGDATLETHLALRRGTGAFGAVAAPEQAFGEGDARFRLFNAELALDVPFRLGAQQFRYAGRWRAQWGRSPLTPQDRFAIGGRYSVRGFDGEGSLLGERGWLVRNDIGWRVPVERDTGGAELYAGIDHGRIGGPSAQRLRGRQLTGAVLGLRGAWKGAGGALGYDIFVGAPIAKPEGFRTARVAAGFSLSYSF